MIEMEYCSQCRELEHMQDMDADNRCRKCAKVNAALNTAAGAAHDERSVTLTREQWERVAHCLRADVRSRQVDSAHDLPVQMIDHLERSARRLAAINRAICEQAGLGEEFRCE